MDFENDENLDYQLNKIASIVIKEKRNNKQMSLDELSNKLNNTLSKQSLFRYENNEARMKNKIFKKICIALGENPSDVWEEINNRFLNSISFDNGLLIDVENDTVQIPVLGVIKAGTPIEAQQDILEYVDIPKSWVRGGKEFYGLKISGDSMYPKYCENDIVIFEYTNDMERANGKDCAVMVNGDDATFKTVIVTENGIQLIPFNPNNCDNYLPTFYSIEDINNKPVKIIGIVKERRIRF